MKLKRLALLWSVVATAAVVLVTPSAAHASLDECPPGYFCVWEHSNGTGSAIFFGETDLYQPDLRTYGFNDRISSLQNNTGVTVCVYQHSYYGGWSIPVVRYGGLGGFIGARNDAVSSLRPC